MAENGPTEKQAKFVSEELFEFFHWIPTPYRDQDWDCELEEHLEFRKVKTHPADVVFYYFHPYKNKYIYIHTDLKSYSKKSINVTSSKIAVRNLSLAVECAKVSSNWHEMYNLTGDDDYDVEGLLFIFNHDGEYDGEFNQVLSSISSDDSLLRQNCPIAVFGPDQIKQMFNIVKDLQSLIVKGKIGGKDKYFFYYPELFLSRTHGDSKSNPATIEMLNSPFMLVKIKNIKNEDGFIIYYNRVPEDLDEFIYLIDTLSHFQILLLELPINIRFTKENTHGAKLLEEAKTNYLKSWGQDNTKRTQLDLIQADTITEFTKSFNLGEISREA